LSARALLLAVAALLVAAPAARADGDPASDYLLGQALFNPPDAGIPSAYATQLAAVIRDAKLGGYEIRVALIATRYDLGSVGVLYRQPKRYARFLGQELYFVYKGRLLVVMSNGLGFSRGGKADAASQAAVDRITAPGGIGPALATAARRAVVRLAAEKRVVVTVPSLTGDAHVDNPNHDRLLIVLATAVALSGFGAFVFLRRFNAGRE
jgi:hypothetical protein